MGRRGPAIKVPHLVPYQGSKRRLAPVILSYIQALRPQRLIEPFAGSAAITLAAAANGVADRYVIGDSLPALVAIWRLAIDQPNRLAAGYADLWRQQEADPAAHYLRVRSDYNRSADPCSLLYLLARCVKNAPRFNAAGAFNQAADHRRRGLHPDRLRSHALGVAALLAGRSEVYGGDFRPLLAQATARDVVYLDPPWAGTTLGRDKRYHRGLATDELVDALRQLDRAGVPFLLSYDGRCGRQSYGAPLPADLGLRHVELAAGRSSQATLLGRNSETVESLYLSRHLPPS